MLLPPHTHKTRDKSWSNVDSGRDEPGRADPGRARDKTGRAGPCQFVPLAGPGRPVQCRAWARLARPCGQSRGLGRSRSWSLVSLRGRDGGRAGMLRRLAGRIGFHEVNVVVIDVGRITPRELGPWRDVVLGNEKNTNLHRHADQTRSALLHATSVNTHYTH